MLILVVQQTDVCLFQLWLFFDRHEYEIALIVFHGFACIVCQEFHFGAYWCGSLSGFSLYVARPGRILAGSARGPGLAKSMHQTDGEQFEVVIYLVFSGQ